MKIINFSECPSLVSQYLMEMRNVDIQGDMLRFRENLARVGEIMAYEISKTLRYRKDVINTPLGECSCDVIDEPIVLATIFRAGVPFHQGFLKYFDHAENAFVSAYRKYRDQDHEKFDVLIEYLASPSVEGKVLMLVDPMLATGSSMELGYRALLTRGNPKHIHVAAVIASQAAVDYVRDAFPADKTTIWVGAIDPDLNAQSYIVPGLGDAGDLAFGEKE